MSVYDAVCQVVAYEAGTGQPEEHVKAQTVATYTYLMNQVESNKTLSNIGMSTTKLDSRTKGLVAEVIGYAVLDDRSDDFILATYFSESCGETADAEWVWGYANRNLLSVSSPVDGKTSKTYRITSSSFRDKVESKTNITLSGNPEDWISVYSYWEGTDYVNQVKLGGTKYSARKLRESVLGGSNLRSTAFDVEYDSAKDQNIRRSFTYIFEGIQKSMPQYGSNYCLTMGIGTAVHSYRDLRKSFVSATSAMQSRFLLGAGKIVYGSCVKNLSSGQKRSIATLCELRRTTALELMDKEKSPIDLQKHEVTY